MPPNSEKLCHRCLTYKPITDFRRRFRDKEARMGTCRECHNNAERLRRQNAQQKRDKKAMRKYLTRVSRERANQQVEFICTEMINYFGGVEAFLNAWKQYCDRAMKMKPGSYPALRCFSTVLRLLQYCHDKKDASEALTNEQEERELDQQLRMLAEIECPHCANRLG